MDKELKKELRRDDVGEALTEARGFLQRSEIGKPLLAVLVLILILAGLYSAQKYRARSAESAFARATEVFHGAVALPETPAPAAGATVVYKTSAEKFTKAKGMFDEAARDYSSQPAGRRAQYYSALCMIELGQAKEAEEALMKIAARKDQGELEPAMAKLRLAEIVLQSGRAADAKAFYEALGKDPNAGLPKDRIQFGLAESLAAIPDRLAARRAYTELVNRFPQSPYAQDARKKIEELASL